MSTKENTYLTTVELNTTALPDTSAKYTLNVVILIAMGSAATILLIIMVIYMAVHLTRKSRKHTAAHMATNSNDYSLSPLATISNHQPTQMQDGQQPQGRMLFTAEASTYEDACSYDNTRGVMDRDNVAIGKGHLMPSTIVQQGHQVVNEKRESTTDNENTYQEIASFDDNNLYASLTKMGSHIDH